MEYSAGKWSKGDVVRADTDNQDVVRGDVVANEQILLKELTVALA